MSNSIDFVVQVRGPGVYLQILPDVPKQLKKCFDCTLLFLSMHQKIFSLLQ